MARQRVIVGLGEALLVEHADRSEPAGLALQIPICAAWLGHEGIALSRLGQDQIARELIAQLRDRGIDVSHLQSDPDLATGRLLVRSIGGKTLRSLDATAAFDNLQWDFDLDDVAQRTDAVVFGALGRRSGQARSASDRFLAACKFALRVFDLTNCPDSGLDRARAMSALKSSEALVIDDVALHALLPGTTGQSPREAVVELIRHGGLTLVLHAQAGQPLTVHTEQSSWSGQRAHHVQAHETSIVGLLHAILEGWELAAAVDLAEQLARHVIEHPGEPPPPALLRRR